MATKGILKCSDELLLDILSYFDALSRELHRTALTCRRLYRIALPILYQGVDFDCMNLASQKSNNLKHLSKITMLEAGDLRYEEDKNLHSYLSGGENVTLKQDPQIYPREWNYPEDVKLAFGQAGASLMVLTTKRVHLCEGADHYWGCEDDSEGSV